jgi:hypothetical protein
VTLVAGERKEVIPVDRLYAGASRDPEWKDDLRYCDCEVLLDRTYFLPLGDESWPDDTLIEFEYMDGVPTTSAAYFVDRCELFQGPPEPKHNAPLRPGEILSAIAAASAVTVDKAKGNVRAVLIAVAIDFESGRSMGLSREVPRCRPRPSSCSLRASASYQTRVRWSAPVYRRGACRRS